MDQTARLFSSSPSSIFNFIRAVNNETLALCMSTPCTIREVHQEKQPMGKCSNTFEGLALAECSCIDLNRLLNSEKCRDQYQERVVENALQQLSTRAFKRVKTTLVFRIAVLAPGKLLSEAILITQLAKAICDKSFP